MTHYRANQLIFDSPLVPIVFKRLLCTPYRRDAKAEAAAKIAGGVVRQGDEKWIAAELVVIEIATLDSVGKAGHPGLARLEQLTCNGGVRGAVRTPRAEPRMVAPERTLMNEHREV